MSIFFHKEILFNDESRGDFDVKLSPSKDYKIPQVPTILTILF
jgi:hypothetical protein